MNVKMYDGFDVAFFDACAAAKVPATSRQYRKWKKKRGAAYACRQPS